VGVRRDGKRAAKGHRRSWGAVMAEIMHMPPRPRERGRRRERPVEGAPLAQVIINGTDFREAIKPTHAEINASIDKLSYHLPGAVRAMKEIARAHEQCRVSVRESAFQRRDQ
jgi:hypothetical protein